MNTRIHAHLLIVFLLLYMSLYLARGEQKPAVKRAGATALLFDDIGVGLDLYELDNGAYPPDIDALLEDTGGQHWNGPYLKFKPEGLLDPWGTPLVYKNEAGKVTLSSAGPDKKFGTEDDIVHKMK